MFFNVQKVNTFMKKRKWKPNFVCMEMNISNLLQQTYRIQEMKQQKEYNQHTYQHLDNLQCCLSPQIELL
jgi:hypothetical protein